MSEKFGALATVLARNLETIEDLPQYLAPPPGVYELLIESVKQEEINDKTALVVEYTVAKTIELNDAEGDAEHIVPEGSKFSEAFWFNDPERIEKTIQVLKAKYGGLAEACGTNDLMGILEKMEGMLVQCIITNRVDKNDKSKIYASTRDVFPAGAAQAVEQAATVTATA